MHRRLLCSALSASLLFVSSPLFAQHADTPKPTAEKPASEHTNADKAAEPEAAPIQTHHTLHVNGQTLNYTATAGMMPLKNDKGETEANIFFMAYTLDAPNGKRDSKRPLMFAFNGGPGSASVWLHLGAIGPRTVHMQQPDGAMPAPPYQVEDNDNTWLAQTDLVFIDPVGTGYSRVTKPELLKQYLGLKGTRPRSASSSGCTWITTSAGTRRCFWWVRAMAPLVRRRSPATCCRSTAWHSTESC